MNFYLCRSAEITLASSISVCSSNCYINRKDFMSTTAWKPKKLIFFKEKMLTLVFLLILCAPIGLFSHVIHKHSCKSQHISVLTTCAFIQARIQELVKGGGHFSKYSSRVAKMSISVSLANSHGEVYIRMLLAYSLFLRKYRETIHMSPTLQCTLIG